MEGREEIGIKQIHLNRKVSWNRMRWAGHVQSIGDNTLPKGAWQAEDGGSEDGEDRGADGKTAWSETWVGLALSALNGRMAFAEDMGAWEEFTTKPEAMKWLDPHPTPGMEEGDEEDVGV